MTRVLELRTDAPDETKAVAGVVARMLRPGDIVALTGELGAGKTCFVQGAAAALGVTERVTSPSFVLRREYQGNGMAILHLDVYRLDTMGDVLDIGFAEALDDSRVTFVEWGDAMAPLLPPDHLEVEFRLPDPADLPPLDPEGAPVDEPRRLVLRAHGLDWSRRLTDLDDGLSRYRRKED